MIRYNSFRFIIILSFFLIGCQSTDLNSKLDSNLAVDEKSTGSNSETETDVSLLLNDFFSQIFGTAPNFDSSVTPTPSSTDDQGFQPEYNVFNATNSVSNIRIAVKNHPLV